MASAVELATAYITIAASGSDLAPSFGRSFKAVERVAGDSGKRMGKALTGQVSKATEQDVEKAKNAYELASKKVTSTVDTQASKVEAARRKEEIAQAKVTEALQKYDAESSQVLSAQDRLAMASQKVEGAQRQQQSATERANRELGETEKQLRDTERAAESAATPFERLGDRMKSALRGDFKGAFKPVEREGQDAANEIERDFRRSGDDSAKSFGSSFKAGFVGAIGGLGAYVGIQELFDWGKYAVSGAADLEQSVGGVQTVFKDSAGEMLAWSAAADQALGLTENEYNEFSARLGASLKNAGTPMDELGGKTNDLITMGADLASLYGGTTAEAVDALGSALRGEMDPIERYGISLNDAALTAEGLAMGIEKTGGSFTMQEKQLISMSLLQKQSADATGNFAREQDTASNVAQRLTARLKETATEVGSRFTPLLADLGSWFLDKGIPLLEDFGKGVEGVWSILAGGDFKGAENTFGLEEDSAAVGFLFDLRDAAIGLWENALVPLGEWISNHWKDIAAFFAGFGGAMVVAGLIALGGAIGGLIASIAWIPLAIGAAVGALTWFFTQTEVGKNIMSAVVDWMVNTAWPAIQTFSGWVADAAVWLWQNVLAPAWAGIRTAIGATVDWLVNSAWPVIKTVWDAIATAAVWLWQDVLVPAWAGIRAAISATSDWITGTLWPALQTAWTAIGTAAMWLWQSVIQPVWTGIKVAIAIAITAILVYIDLLKWYFTSVIAPVAMWLWQNVLQPAWNGIKTAIGAVVAWMRDTAWPILKAAWDAIAAAARWLYSSVILPVWNAIRSAISAVVSWLQNTAWPLINTVIGWLKTSFEGWKLLAQAVWSAVRSAVNTVVAWFRDTAWPIISTVIGYIKTGFRVMRDSLKNAWNFIKDSVIAPVANWFRDTVGPLFDRVTGGIKDAFNLMKDAVQTAWEGIRDTAKVPVEFVVNKIINDAIIGNYNDVANGVFGLDKVDPVSLPSGWTRGGILPGQSSWRDGDDQLIAARRGEGVLVSEGLRDRESQSMFLQANAAARTRGTSFADFVSGGFAGGGLVKLRMPFAGSYPRGDGFGARGGAHKGIDWPMPSGATLKAVAAGTTSRTWNPSAGNKLNLSIGNGLIAGYHHLSSYIAGRGASVSRGEDIARVGSTGRSSGPHLHFSLKKDGNYVDPMPYLGAGGAAGDGSGGGWWNPFSGIWDSLKDQVREGVGDSPWGNTLFEMPQKILGGAVDWAKDKLSGLTDWGSGSDGGSGTDRWSSLAEKALRMTGNYSAGNLSSMLRRMNQESGGDPNAINNWDSNAAAGMPSKGLMQVIPPTFRAHAEPGYASNIWDPLSNFLASINYTDSRYSSLQAGWNRAGGYTTGGLVDGGIFDTGGVLDSGNYALNLSGRPEVVLNPNESKAYLAGQASTGSTGERGTTNVYVTPPSTDDPGIWGQRVADSLDLHELAAVAGGS